MNTTHLNVSANQQQATETASPLVITTLWHCSQAFTAAHFLLTLYTLGCLLRYGLRNEKFKLPTATRAISNGQTNLYKVVTVTVSLCLPAIALTQMELIISANSSDFTAAKFSPICSVTALLKVLLHSLICVLGYASIWYVQRLFYERSAVKYLRTRAYTFVSWLCLILCVTITPTVNVIDVFARTIDRSDNGCGFGKSIWKGTNASVYKLSACLSFLIVLVIMTGLFLYPLNATKKDEMRPAGEGLAKAVMHRYILQRYTFCVVLLLICGTLPKVLSSLVLNNPMYASMAHVVYVLLDTALLIKSAALVLCLDDKRKVMFWWAF